MRAKLAIAVGLGIAACASPYDRHPYHLSRARCSSSATETDRSRAKRCVEQPEVRDYLEAIKAQVYDAWQPPQGIDGNQTVVAEIRVDPTGAVQCLSIRAGGSRSLVDSVISAIEDAEPFPALTPDVACLSGIPIVGSFSNPLDTGERARRH